MQYIIIIIMQRGKRELVSRVWSQNQNNSIFSLFQARHKSPTLKSGRLVLSFFHCILLPFVMHSRLYIVWLGTIKPFLTSNI